MHMMSRLCSASFVLGLLRFCNGSPSPLENTLSGSVETLTSLLSIPPHEVNGVNGGLHVMRDHSSGLILGDHLVRVREALSTESHEVTFVIQQKNIEKLRSIFHEVSDPAHPNYGNHLTQKEIINLTSNPESYEEVLSYLKASGAEIMPASPTKVFITARASLSLWERMFDTKFDVYSIRSDHKSFGDHPVGQNKTTFMRALKYSVPLSLDAHVASVKNIVETPMELIRSQPQTPVKLTNSVDKSRFSETSRLEAGYVTPQLFNNVYNIKNNTGHPRATQTAVQGFAQVHAPEDLALFQEVMDLPLQPISLLVNAAEHTVPASYCREHSYYCAESNLDFQYMIAVARAPTPTWHVYNDEVYLSSWLLKWIYGSTPPPLVMSFSYGYEETYMTAEEKDLFDQAAMMMGAMGVTILIASGDDGACNPKGRYNSGQCAYRPTFPNTSPYVTSVGGTQGPEIGQPETVAQNDRGGSITTGGGFSYHYPVPSWQSDAVAGYLAQVNGTTKAPYPGYNVGRGFPDISLLSHNFIFTIGGNIAGNSGTSVSAPAFGGIISLVNAARFRAGGKSVGFINPILYGKAALFTNDVTFGDNRCTATSTCCKEGFHATPGWDPATGLGSINFEKFRDYMISVMNMASPTRAPSARPTSRPTVSPTQRPTTSARPTSRPTVSPTEPLPTLSARPTSHPTVSPTQPLPTPSARPTSRPTVSPTQPLPTPSARPTSRSTVSPTQPVPTQTIRAKPSRRPRPANIPVSQSPTIKPILLLPPTPKPTLKPPV